MKRLLIMAFAVVPMLAMAQDDLYFTASKKPKEQAKAYVQKRSQEEAAKVQRYGDMTARVEAYEPPVQVDYNSNRRGEDEYNRRYVYSGDYQNAGGVYSDSLSASVETEGYVSEYDMEDPELDYRFSRRLVRFHNPRLYALASPYYWDLYYGYGAWDYLYAPYDPWFHHYGWRYGWTWGPWDCWYGSIWGWHSPYAWTYWGWGPGWHHPPMHGGWHHAGVRNIVPRQINSSRGHLAAGSRLRTNAMGRSTMSSRSNVVGNRSGSALGSRSNSVGSRSNSALGSRSNSVGSRSNSALGSRSGVNEGRVNVPNSRTRTSAQQRSNATTRNDSQASSRSNSNQNAVNRQSSNYNTPSRSSSSSSNSSRSSSGGGSFGGGSRSGGGGGFGGGSRGGGGRR